MPNANSKLRRLVRRVSSIRSKSAARSFRADRPGIIFIKVSEMNCGRRERCCNGRRGRKFLRNTDRIVAITFCVSHLETHDSVVMHRHALRELTNETSRFNQGRNWELFTNYYVPSSWNGMPPKWQRLFFFPKGAKTWTSPEQRGQFDLSCLDGAR